MNTCLPRFSHTAETLTLVITVIILIGYEIKFISTSWKWLAIAAQVLAVLWFIFIWVVYTFKPDKKQ